MPARDGCCERLMALHRGRRYGGHDGAALVLAFGLEPTDNDPFSLLTGKPQGMVRAYQPKIWSERWSCAFESADRHGTKA